MTVRGIDLRDVIEGNIAPAVVLAVIASLPVGCKTMAMMAAKEQGGHWTEWFGRDASWFQGADLYDGIFLQIKATGHWKGKPPAFPPYPRPGAHKKKKKTSLMDLYSRMTQAQKTKGGGRL